MEKWQEFETRKIWNWYISFCLSVLILIAPKTSTIPCNEITKQRQEMAQTTPTPWISECIKLNTHQSDVKQQQTESVDHFEDYYMVLFKIVRGCM